MEKPWLVIIGTCENAVRNSYATEAEAKEAARHERAWIKVWAADKNTPVTIVERK